MAVEIAKPDTHRREYSFIELPNKIRCVVGSDSACDKAGAALCVNVGMCYERQDLPGLAHFLEHMLFTGTKKYPSEGDYHQFIQQNGGMANAYTECYRTNYMFEIKPDKLVDALDRFARFFSEPLLTRDCTEREINAVDSEYQAGATMPWWRYVGIMNMSANEAHPWHVAVGNNKVLLHDPKERGVDLYDEMLKLYNEFYSANGMTLCVIGRESVEELRGIISEKFAEVVDKGLTLPLGDEISSEPAFLPKEWNRYLIQSPAKDVKELTFSWVLPWQGRMWRSKPFKYVSHLLGHEGKGSITAVLKEKGLISGCSSGGGGWLEGAFSLLNVTFELTDKGLNSVQEIGDCLFTYLGLLRQSPVEEWVFEELQKLGRIRFKFGEDTTPFNLSSRISSSLQVHPAEQVLEADYCVYDYDPTAISEMIAKLTLEGVRVRHTAKAFEERCTDRDTQYNSPIKFLPLEASWLEAWSASMCPGATADAAAAAALAKGLSMPKPNPFIPEDLSLKDLPPTPPLYPERVPSTPAPASCIYHRQDDVFRQPKLRVSYLVRTPFVYKDAASNIAATLWCMAVEEELKDFTYDAHLGEVNYSLNVSPPGVRLDLAGFHDKLPVLLRAVADKMKAMTTVPQNSYDIVADSLRDGLQNVAFHSKPYAQCSRLFSDLQVRGASFPIEDLLEAFKTLSASSLDGMFNSIFDVCHVEALVLGNAKPDGARSLAADFVSSLGLKDGLSKLPEVAEATLPPGPTVWNMDSTDVDDPNHAVRLCYQLGNTIEEEVMVCLLGKVLAPKFFEILRTQQQLGYVVQMATQTSCSFSYIIGVVQTEFAPDYVRGRIDTFLNDQFKIVEETLTEEEFQTCKAGLLSEYETKPKNLGQESQRLLKFVSWRTYEFDRREKCKAFLKEKADLESMRVFLREKVRPAPRLYIQVKKVLDKPDKELPEGASVPDDAPDLRKWSGYQEVVSNFGASATWVKRNDVVDS